MSEEYEKENISEILAQRWSSQGQLKILFIGAIDIKIISISAAKSEQQIKIDNVLFIFSIIALWIVINIFVYVAIKWSERKKRRALESNSSQHPFEIHHISLPINPSAPPQELAEIVQENDSLADQPPPYEECF